MSEYQSYEFRKLTGTLDDHAMKEVSALSSRAQLTRTSASFVYHFADFPGKPLTVLTRHFDLMLYLANWGSQWLALRFPLSAIDAKALRAFALADCISLEEKGAQLILSASFYEEDTWCNAEGLGEGAMDRIVGLYDDLLGGDYRALFLLWLRGMALAPDEDRAVAMPPVPPGLNELSPRHEALIELFQIDPDVVSAAAAFSDPVETVSDEELGRALEAIPVAEQTGYLRRMLRGEAPTLVVAELRTKLRESRPRGGKHPTKAISASVVFERARRILKERERNESERRRAAELHRLAEIERDEDRHWQRVDRLIADKTTKSYDEAVGILQKLRDLAAHKGRRPEFVRCVEGIRDGHSRLTGLKARIEHGDLL